jgi:hypothetical protein
MIGAEYYHARKQNDRMEDKPARLTVLIDADKKKAFEALCASQDITASQMVRQLIRDYLVKHGVEEWGSSAGDETD